eukprot:CAMPEP_0194365894 /NCGR_PEP_ID=MMETSP0174-20130528/13876_1 /TAXON_ID=216777 /ORGANISM="Proboscia alata, Strain PI-D3" /LENGTH=450 /DNA_ID=CAMNT_0039140763 /DNA_START=101 /DNA_END=1450 /DNA_ORIENTATION=+
MTSMRSQQQPNPFRGSMDENHELPSSTRMANSNISSMVSQMTGIITPPSQQQHPSQPQANQLYQQNHNPHNQQYQQQQQRQVQVHQPQQYPTQITAQRLQQPNPPVNSHEARKAWRLHGTDNSQVLEDRRNNLRSQSFSSPTHTSTSTSPSPSNPNEGTGASSIQSVRVSAAENRVDITGASYTTYVMEVELTNTHPSPSKITVEHRYSSFLKLHTYLTLHSIHLRSSFPRRSLAGRLGHWTPSTQWAPRAEHELVGYRKIKLDIWLVELAEVVSAGAGVGGRLRAEERERVLLFFRRGDILPCDAVNEIRGDGGAVNGNGNGNHIRDDGNYLMNYPTAGPSLIAPSYHACHTSCHGHTLNSSPGMSYTPSTSTFRPLNKPISFTLGSEIRKAAHTLRSMCGTSSDFVDDSQIPLDLLRNAHGLCFLTVLKAGFLMSGRIGTGLVIARQP